MNSHQFIECFTTPGQLAAFLFNQLDQTRPRIAVRTELIGAKLALLQDLSNSKVVPTPPAYYSEILTNIYWNAAPPKADRCGLQLLRFMGGLSEAMGHYERYQIPVIRAVEAMIYVSHIRSLHYTRLDRNWWVRSSAKFVQDFGFSVRVKLPREPTDDVFDLRDL